MKIELFLLVIVFTAYASGTTCYSCTDADSSCKYPEKNDAETVECPNKCQYTYAKTDETGEIIGRGCQIGQCVNQKEVSGNEIAEIVCCGGDKCNGKGAAPALAISYVLLMVALVVMKMLISCK